MTKKPNRTRPLDRDGDGTDGGSLPGNGTAPMVSDETVQTTYHAVVVPVPRAADEPQVFGVRTNIPGLVIKADDAEEGLKLTTALAKDLLAEMGLDLSAVTIEVETDADAEEQARIEQDNADRATAEAAARWTEPEVGAQQPDAEPDDRSADKEADDDQPTFTPEEIAAGARPVADQDGEVETPAAATATRIDDDDPLVQIETETAPIAVRVRELKILVNARRLYKSEHGYSENHGAPYIEDATVQAWIKAGLVEDVPSAGNHGGVRLLPEARRQLTLIRRGAAA